MAPPYRFKRFLDLLIVILLAPFWLPVIGIVAVIVRLSLGRPVLFVQQRPGMHERPFALRKFRTMTSDRDSEGRLRPDAARLTRVGRMLRATSLDELPELVNVLRGEMSLVGPRPLLPEYLPLYSDIHRQRHLVPPGITGLAQVSGRNALSWEDRFDLDVEYVRRCSLRLDLSILARTIRSVLRQDGISHQGEATMRPFAGYANDGHRSP